MRDLVPGGQCGKEPYKSATHDHVTDLIRCTFRQIVMVPKLNAEK